MDHGDAEAEKSFAGSEIPKAEAESDVPEELDVSRVRPSTRPSLSEDERVTNPPAVTLSVPAPRLAVTDDLLEQRLTDPPSVDARWTDSPEPALDDMVDQSMTDPPPGLDFRVTNPPGPAVDDLVDESVTDPPGPLTDPVEQRAVDVVEEDETPEDPYSLEETYEPDDTPTPIFVKDVQVLDAVATAPGMVIYKGEDEGQPVLIVGLPRSASSEEKDRFASIFPHRAITGVKPARANASATIIRRYFSGSLSNVLALDERLPERVAIFVRLALLYRQFHAQGISIGPLDPDHVFLDEHLKPFILGPGIAPYHRAYTPPETIRGSYVDPLSDVFTLGKLLYYLTGKDTPPIEKEDPPRLDGLIDMPAGLSRIIRRATRRDPVLRYASVDEMLQDVQMYGRWDEVGLAHPDVAERNRGGLSEPPPRWCGDDDDPTTAGGNITDITGIRKLAEITGIHTLSDIAGLSTKRLSLVSRMQAKRRRRHAVLGAVLIACLSVFGYNAAPKGAELEALAPALAKQASDHLVELSISKDPPMLFGKVADHWYELSEEEQRVEAERILAHSRAVWKIPDGFLLRGDAVVVQFWAGHVITFPAGEP